MARIGASGTGGASNGSGSGNVTGIPPTTIDAIARWDDTVGQTIKNSPGTLIQDSGAIEAQGFITNRQVSGTVTVNATESWITSAVEMQPGSVIIIEPGGQLILI
jgi:hypothetical protein